jgi:hypothetical protein
MKKILSAFLLLMCATTASAEPVLKMYAGANGVVYHGEAGFPNDFELGGTARASLSQHLALVGGAWYGLGESYMRGTVGARATATDVTNPNFSIGFGAEYQASSKPEIRSEEWLATASVGWRPYPESMPKVIIGAQGAYGLSSETATGMICLRYLLGSAIDKAGAP